MARRDSPSIHEPLSTEEQRRLRAMTGQPVIRATERLIDPNDPRHSARLSFMAFAKAARWDHDMRTFKAACEQHLRATFGDLLPENLSDIVPSLWVQAAEHVAGLDVFELVKLKNALGCEDRPDVARAKAHKKRRTRVASTQPFRPGDWVTPRNWRSTRYQPWVKSVIRVEGLEVVLYGDKRELAVNMRRASQAEKEAYFARVKARKSR